MRIYKTESSKPSFIHTVYMKSMALANTTCIQLDDMGGVLWLSIIQPMTIFYRIIQVALWEKNSPLFKYFYMNIGYQVEELMASSITLLYIKFIWMYILHM